MIDISENTRRAYMDDSYDKQLVIEFGKPQTNVDGVNLFHGSMWNQDVVQSVSGGKNTLVKFKSNILSMSDDFSDSVACQYLKCRKNVYIIFDFRFQESADYIGGEFRFELAYEKSDGSSWYKWWAVHHTDEFYGKGVQRWWLETDGIRDDIAKIISIRMRNMSEHVMSYSAEVGGFSILAANELPLEYKNNYIEPLGNYSILGEPIPYDSSAIEPLTNENLKAESFLLTESLCSADNLKFGLCESSVCEFSYYGREESFRGQTINVSQYLVDKDGNKTEKVPLGRFKVTSSQKQSSGGTSDARKIVAYDGLLKLEENAADWYTMYMFGITTDQVTTRYGIEFARQIYSTYFNFASSIGLESRDMNDRLCASIEYSTLKSSYLSNKYISWESTKPVHKIRYLGYQFSNPNPEKLYAVEFDNTNNISDEELVKLMPNEFREKFDSLGRGVASNGSILIEETRANGSPNRFCCNKGDYFMLSPDCVSFMIYTPIYSSYEDGSGLARCLDRMRIYESERTANLENGWIRLMYYNWLSKEIFARDSSITGRDVIRSLLEVCGCFLKLDRHGKPQFKYCTKSSLYPSETLYPKDILFPRGNEGILANALYMKFECEDYTVQDYGKIQIKKNTDSNEAKSIVELQYIGDPNKKNAYIIEDNIFYCHKEMEYEYDSMDEVSEMLENMYRRIFDMGYVPHDTVAVGMPFLECGDRITLLTENGGIESFIFSRNLTGIQSMQDNYEAKGDEYNEEINDFGYKEWRNTDE